MTKKIIKIAENNVEYTETITLTDKDGREFLQWGETESYGQDIINDQLVAAQKALADANTLDEVAYKKDLITVAQAKIDKLGLIQARMDK